MSPIDPDAEFPTRGAALAFALGPLADAMRAHEERKRARERRPDLYGTPAFPMPPKMPLRPQAVQFLATLPRKLNTNHKDYRLALALVDEGLVRLINRTVFRNGQVRYTVIAVPVNEV